MTEYLILPFSPMDLVEVYANKEKLLKVDLEASLANLPMKQLLVYISNTKFEVEFNDVTDELLVEYMETNFNVKCPQLEEIITQALHGLQDIPSIRVHIGDMKKIIKSIPNYVLDNLEEYSDGKILVNKPEFSYIDTPLSVGYNAVRLVRACQILMIDLLQKEEVEDKIYTYYMNNKPKYEGNDFYFFLHANNFMPTVFSVIQNFVKENPNDKQ